MGKKTVAIKPKTEEILLTMGRQIKTARENKALSMVNVAERAGISRTTLWAVEKGTPTVAIGIYAAVLNAINGLDSDLLLVARDRAS